MKSCNILKLLGAAATLAAAGGLLCGCEGEVLLKFGSIRSAKEKVTLSLCCDSPEGGVGVKSALFRDEEIQDVNLYVWSGGKCISRQYFPLLEGGTISLDLARRRSYSFYVLANCGKEITPSESGWESDEQSMERLTVGLEENGGSEGASGGEAEGASGGEAGGASEGEAEGASGGEAEGGASAAATLIPLSGALRDYSLPEIGTQITIRLQRLFCRIVLRFSSDVALSGSGLKVSGVRLCDAPLSVRAFTEKSRAEGEEQVSEGDYSSEEDLARLNSGQEVEFYAFENCWGDLLPSNTDPKQKVPDNLEIDRGPTYLEVSCSFARGKLLEGDLTYRIYLGSDITSNFDLERNSSYSISLSGSKNGLDELSWRIDKNVSYNDNLASFTITEGRHGADDIYIGEIFRGKISDIDPSVTAFFGGSIQQMAARCTLRCLNPDNPDRFKDAVAFDIDGVGDDGTLLVTGTGINALSGAQLWICESGGDNLVTRIDGQISVWAPEVVLSEDERSEVPSAITGNPTAVLNGEQLRLNAYFCDRDARNLLGSEGENLGFSSEVFRIGTTLQYKTVVSASKKCFSTTIENCYDDGDPLEDQPYCTIVLKATNDGESYAVNSELWKVVETSGPLVFGMRDETGSVKASTGVDIGYTPISMVFYDAAFGGSSLVEEYGFSAAEERMFVMVDNPSKMSFKFRYSAVSKRGEATPSINTDTTQDGTSICFYNCPASLSLPEELHLHYAEAFIKSVSESETISCKVTDCGEGSLTRIGWKWNFTNLIKTVQTTLGRFCYNKYGYYDSSLTSNVSRGFRISGGICAMFDFASGLDGKMSYSYDDSTQDSSSESDYLYLNDYDPLTLRFYSAGNYIGNLWGESYSYSGYPDLKPWNLGEIVGNRREVSLAMNSSSSDNPYFTLKTDKTFASVRAQAALTCTGACNTYANGTKRDPVYYSFEKSANASSVYLQNFGAGTAKSLTGSSIYSLFTSVYNTIYTDSYNWYGNKNNWPHHSHPVKLTLDATFTEYGSSHYLYDFAKYSPVSLTYDNSGYVAEDANPYTVVTAVDWKSLHSKFTHKMILLQ